MTQKIFTIIFLLSLSSCIFLTENNLDQTVSEDNFLNRFPENKKSIIILKLQGKKRDRIYLCEEKKILISKIEDCTAIYANDQYRILMLKPANYYLFTKPENRPIISEKKVPLMQKYFANLNLKSGEIVYIGDIAYKSLMNNNDEELSGKDLGQKFIIRDNFKLVNEILEGKNQKQKDKLFSNQIWEINYLIKNYSKLQNRLSLQLLQNTKQKNNGI